MDKERNKATRKDGVDIYLYEYIYFQPLIS